jgi:hypothetical protein
MTVIHRFLLTISALGVVVVASVVPEGSLFAAGYKLALSEEPAVCKRMLDLSNKGLLKASTLDGSTPRPFSEELSFIEWKELDNLSEQLAYRKDSLHSAIFDIDNDGQIDWVVKVDQFLSSLQSENLAVFRNHASPPKYDRGITIEDINKADVSINTTEQEYLLKKIPKHRYKDDSQGFYSIRGGAFLVPFRYQNITYILWANPFEEALWEGRKFTVVTKLSPKAELDDVCYIEEIRGTHKK